MLIKITFQTFEKSVNIMNTMKYLSVFVYSAWKFFSVRTQQETNRIFDHKTNKNLYIFIYIFDYETQKKPIKPFYKNNQIRKQRRKNDQAKQSLTYD